MYEDECYGTGFWEWDADENVSVPCPGAGIHLSGLNLQIMLPVTFLCGTINRYILQLFYKCLTSLWYIC
jgi:hypothetical protein